jgi:hypothetical protein
MKQPCGHRKGTAYEKNGAGKELCTYILDDPVDGYEFSFVAVPAQRNAGASKNSTGNPASAPQAVQEPQQPGEPPSEIDESEKAAALAVQAELAAIRAKNTIIN